MSSSERLDIYGSQQQPTSTIEASESKSTAADQQQTTMAEHPDRSNPLDQQDRPPLRSQEQVFAEAVRIEAAAALQQHLAAAAAAPVAAAAPAAVAAPAAAAVPAQNQMMEQAGSASRLPRQAFQSVPLASTRELASGHPSEEDAGAAPPKRRRKHKQQPQLEEVSSQAVTMGRMRTRQTARISTSVPADFSSERQGASDEMPLPPVSVCPPAAVPQLRQQQQQQFPAVALAAPDSSTTDSLSYSSVSSQGGKPVADASLGHEVLSEVQTKLTELQQKATQQGYVQGKQRAQGRYERFKKRARRQLQTYRDEINTLKQQLQAVRQQRSAAEGRLGVVGSVLESAADAANRGDRQQWSAAAELARAANAAGRTGAFEQLGQAAQTLYAAAFTSDPITGLDQHAASAGLQQLAEAAGNAAAEAAALAAGTVSGQPAAIPAARALLPVERPAAGQQQGLLGGPLTIPVSTAAAPAPVQPVPVLSSGNQQPDELTRALQRSAQVAMDASAAALARGTISASIQPAIVPVASALPPVHRPSAQQQLDPPSLQVDRPSVFTRVGLAGPADFSAGHHSAQSFADDQHRSSSSQPRNQLPSDVPLNLLVQREANRLLSERYPGAFPRMYVSPAAAQQHLSHQQHPAAISNPAAWPSAPPYQPIKQEEEQWFDADLDLRLYDPPRGPAYLAQEGGLPTHYQVSSRGRRQPSDQQLRGRAPYGRRGGRQH